MDPKRDMIEMQYSEARCKNPNTLANSTHEKQDEAINHAMSTAPGCCRWLKPAPLSSFSNSGALLSCSDRNRCFSEVGLVICLLHDAEPKLSLPFPLPLEDAVALDVLLGVLPCPLCTAELPADDVLEGGADVGGPSVRR